MKVAQFADPQYVDAIGLGGLNAAFGTVSGAIASEGMGVWAAPGLIAPEAMTNSIAGMVVTIGLPSPWALVSSGGVLVHAHGTQSNQDTTSYSANFAPLVPGSGSVTAYLNATIQTIQQNPVPIPGPPPGHPSYNPNFVPTVGYATTAYTVAVSATTTAPDNVNSFELFRTTLTAGQSTITNITGSGWTRAADRKAWPYYYATTGGTLTVAQAQQMILPQTTGLTFTLPAVANCGGLEFGFVNPTSGNVTIAATSPDTIVGISGGPVASVVVPTGGSLIVYGAAPNGIWTVIGFNTANNNHWSGTNEFNTLFVDTDFRPNSFGSYEWQFSADGSGTKYQTYRSGGWFDSWNGTTGLRTWHAPAGAAMTLDGGGNLTTLGVVSATQIWSSQGMFQVAPNYYLQRSSTDGSWRFVENSTVNATIDNAGNYHARTGVYGTYLQSTGNVQAAGTYTGGAVAVNGNVQGQTVDAFNGNVTANGGRLRASLGALGSGDPSAAAILSDFTLNIGGGGDNLYLYQRFPSGMIIQTYGGINSTGADFITFPVAFPHNCAQVIMTEGAPSGWISGTSPTIFGAQQLSAVSFALYVARWNPDGHIWFLAGSISYRYIAIGY